MKKKPLIFISHSSKNKDQVAKIADLLRSINLSPRRDIFCSSLPGYGIPNGANIFDFLRERFLNYDLHIIFVHSPEYYESPVSLNEMGAAWVLRANATSLLLPGFDFSGMLGLQSNVEIGGRSGFIFNTKHGRPIMPAGVNSFLKNIVNAYNKKESKLAEEEKREPELMPPISSHTLRHTGCTRLGENNVNPKVMQYVMGHSDAQITMNVYNHIAEKSHVENEMSKMNLPETVPAVV